MATTAKWYGLGLKHCLSDVNVATDTIKAAILGAGYTPNQDTDEFWSAVSANEVVGTGYTAGGITVVVSLSYDGTTNTVKLTLPGDVTWSNSTITGRYVVFYKSTGTAATSPLLGWQDAGVAVSSSGGAWTFTPDANGILNASAA